MHTLSYQAALAQRAFNGELEPLMCWLTFVAGHRWNGLWQPAIGLSKAECVRIMEGLSRQQIDDLAWRGFIPGPGSLTDKPKLLIWEEHDYPCHFTPSGALLIEVTEGTDTREVYMLPNKGQIGLRAGEFELLSLAGFPCRWHDVLAVLWRHIAPAVEEHTLAARLRDISAIVHSLHDPLAQLLQVRELVFSPVEGDRHVARLVEAERAVIQAAHAAVQDGWQDSDLAVAVRTLQGAIDDALHAGAIPDGRPILPS